MSEKKYYMDECKEQRDDMDKIEAELADVKKKLSTSQKKNTTMITQLMDQVVRAVWSYV